MSASPAKTLAALRQLATLGLPGKSAVPEAIGLLNRLVGFDVWGLRFMDAHCRIIDGFASPDIPASLLRDFAENFHNREAGVTASNVMQSGQRVLLASCLANPRNIEGTDLWQRILRPAGVTMPAHLPLLLGGSSPFAMIVMSRALGAPDYSAAAVRLLEEAQPWLCHLLARTEADPTSPHGEDLATGDTGLLILGPSGKIESASPGAVTLLLNAVDVGIGVDAGSLRQAVSGDARSLLKGLAQAVGANGNGKPAPLPAGTFRNRYGSFKLRAYALDAFASGSAHRVSVHVERRAPLSQRLFSAPRFLALPNREREVALCLARGRSHTETAAELNIKPSSVIDATRSLYHRLAIDSRSKLVPALLLGDG